MNSNTPKNQNLAARDPFSDAFYKMASQNLNIGNFEKNFIQDKDKNPPPEGQAGHEVPVSKPWEERLKRDSTHTRIFAFLVGINDYNPGVKDLNGCVKDVENVERYLRSVYTESASEDVATSDSKSPIKVIKNKNLHLCVLTDQDATYTNVIRGFREHLANATGKDSVWFHFSGHGAEQYTAKEFRKSVDQHGNEISIEPNGKDQTLVLYKKPDSNDPQYIADKELAVLLDEVARARSKKGQYPHIVVSIDACHSGSSTRDHQEPAGLSIRSHEGITFPTWDEAEMADRKLRTKHKLDQVANPTKNALVPTNIRSLDSYIEGYYSKKGNLEVPSAEHVLLSACRTIETAGDLPAGGIFTLSMLEALETAHKENRKLHYSQLFTQTRAMAHKRRSAQGPQFETIDGFDPYTCFVEGWPLGTPDQYEVFNEGSNWYVRCGAIHGLPVNSNGKIKIRILNAKNAEVAAFAFAEKVGAQHSKLSISGGVSLSTGENYVAEILSLPATPVYVKVSGDKSTADPLTKGWDSSKNILLAEEGQLAETPAIEIVAQDNGDFIIKDAHSGKTFSEIPAVSGDGKMSTRINLVQEDLEKIVKWMRTIELDNPNSKISNKFDFELMVMDKSMKITPHKGKEIELIGNETNLLNNKTMGFNFRVTLKDNSQDLFFYAFDLSTNCAIRFRNDESKVARSKSMSVGQTMDLRTKPYGWGMSLSDKEVVRWFKLFVTTEELDYHQLVQKGLGGSREEEEEDFNPGVISDDWCAVTMKVTMVRQAAETA